MSDAGVFVSVINHCPVLVKNLSDMWLYVSTEIWHFDHLARDANR